MLCTFTRLKSALFILLIMTLLVYNHDRVRSASESSDPLRPAQTTWTSVTAIDVYSTVLPIVGATYPDLVDADDLSDKARVTGWTLSPDGTTLFILFNLRNGERDMQSCLYTIADQSVVCRPYEAPAPQRDFPEGRLAWSPDGSHIVTHGDWIVLADDPDLHLIEVGSGVVSNITDDGYEDNVFGAGEEAFFIDYAPFWAADSQSIYFFRLDRPSEALWDMQLMNLRLDSGEATVVADLSGVIDGATFAYPQQVALSPDGQRVVILSSNMRDDKIGLSVYNVDLTTGIAELWVSRETIYRLVVPIWSEDPRVYGRDVLWSADGRFVVVALDYAIRGEFSTAYAELLPLNYLIIEAASGEVRPLVDIGQFPDMETYNNLGGYFKFSPVLGLLTPDGQLIYATVENTQRGIRPATFWSVPLTLDADPVQLSTVDLSVGFLSSNDIFQDRFLGMIARNGVAMVQSDAAAESQSAYLLQLAE
ncbi:MAG: DPP IV N-terminal domain-containing protein [Anaerolineae bacterium]|nr:DPP IV N-terminal domain-containing protein [Anaerolineae bacterium]